MGNVKEIKTAKTPNKQKVILNDSECNNLHI
jgi:hypothetical protein